MALITLVGPHAIGKTTAIKRWANRYAIKLVAISADLQRKYVGSKEEREVGWAESVESKSSLVKHYLDTDLVAVVESARTTTLNFLSEDDPVLVVSSPPVLFEGFMRERCLAKNKRFREDYWTEQRLGYESARRYLNFANKNLHPDQWVHFEIKDQERDWKTVDEHFGKVFRKLYNQLNHQRRLK